MLLSSKPKRHRYPASVISFIVWRYHRFNDSYRDISETLAFRGIVVSYETVRKWCLKFASFFCTVLSDDNDRFNYYVKNAKADGSQSYDLQIDALRQAGVKAENIYKEKLSGKNTDRPELTSCLRPLRQGDVLIVWKLDRLGRSLKDLVSIVDEINETGVSFKVLSGHGASIDTSTPAGKMVFGIFSALAEYERELIRERTIAGLSAARARGKVGGRKFKLTKNQLRMVQY